MKINNSSLLIAYNPDIPNSTSTYIPTYLSFRGKADPCQDIFSKEKISEPKIITIEDTKKAGEEFLRGAKDDNSAENVTELYKNYHKTIMDYYEQNDFRVLRHEWANAVNTSFYFMIDKAEEKDEKIEFKEVEKIVKKTNNLIDVHQLLCQNGTATGESIKVFDMRTVFKTALNIAKENAETKNIKLIVQNENLLNELEQGGHQFKNYTIFSNILGNAIKYSPEKSDIKIKFIKQKDEYIYSNGKHSGEFDLHYYFIVEDKGIGIPEKDQGYILQGNRGSNVGDIYGTGQGLQDVINASGGKIEITSPLYSEEPKYKGTSIKVKLNGWKKPKE